MHRFRDRQDAGQQLAAVVRKLALVGPVVLGLPRGGVPVAAEVARALGAPLDVIVVRKLGVPWQPELAMGAVGEGGTVVLNDRVVQACGIPSADLDQLRARQAAEVAERAARLRPVHPRVPLAGRTAVIVDDGLATGATARAALLVARAQGAAGVAIAVPVAPADTVRALAALADQVVALRTPATFSAVGAYYRDFSQTTDGEVVRLLASARLRLDPISEHDPRSQTCRTDPSPPST